MQLIVFVESWEAFLSTSDFHSSRTSGSDRSENSNFHFVFKLFGVVVSKNNCWELAAEIVFDKQSSTC